MKIQSLKKKPFSDYSVVSKTSINYRQLYNLEHQNG